jgi:hypothetical protein
MPRTQVALAGRIRPGDVVDVDGRLVAVTRVKRAQGRKPPKGENLHVVLEDGGLLRVNSLAPVRIQARTAP